MTCQQQRCGQRIAFTYGCYTYEVIIRNPMRYLAGTPGHFTRQAEPHGKLAHVNEFTTAAFEHEGKIDVEKSPTVALVVAKLAR